MDIFMDKLAQKLTAQEIIKANTAADTEEMNKLKNQIEEYNEYLTKLNNLIKQGEERLKGYQAEGKETERLIQESLKGLQEVRGQVRQSGESLIGTLQEFEKNIQDKLTQIGTATDENVHKECVKVYRNVQAVVVEESGKQLKAVEETRSKAGAIDKKLGFILGVSVAALIFALAGVTLQILSALNISLF